MAIDLAKALAAKHKPVTTSYKETDVILYNLGIGTGLPPANPTSSENLQYLFEENLKVLPSYGVIPVFPMMDDVVQHTDGIDIDFSKVLHGEQGIVMHRPMPKNATLVHQATIPAIWDKGKAAVIILQVETKEEGGDPICTNTFTVFARGAGGFGGERGPGPTNVTPSEMAPDLEFEAISTVRQPLLYRLTGDMNPLHADPAVAKKAGFPKPILQGLSTFGMACKAVIDNVLDGDVSRVTGFGTRFSGIFFPGETMVIKVWKQKGKLLIAAHSKERNSAVLGNGWMTFK